jgi:hypothetical protein
MPEIANRNVNRKTWGRLIVSWLWVGVPLVWGVWETLHTSLALFR